MAYTGYQRSLTVQINKTVAGVQADGYPHTYYGRNEFTWNSVTYPVIDALTLATMPVADFNTRLAAFKSYVENLEAGLDMAVDIVAGSDAYQQNTTACPIG